MPAIVRLSDFIADVLSVHVATQTRTVAIESGDQSESTPMSLLVTQNFVRLGMSTTLVCTAAQSRANCDRMGRRE